MDDDIKHNFEKEFAKYLKENDKEKLIKPDKINLQLD